MICIKYNALSFRDVQDQFITYSLLLATHSKTDCNSLFLLRVSVTSSAVVDEEYMIESSACMDTHALFNASGRSLVKIEKSRRPRELPCGTPHLFDIREASIKENTLSYVR